MNEFQELVQQTWAVSWVRAGVVLVATLIAAKLTDIVICKGLVRLAGRSNTDIDDRLISQLHRPIFISVAAFGLNIAVGILEPPPGFKVVFTGTLQTVVLLLWLVAGARIISTGLEGLGRVSGKVRWVEARTIPLFDNLAKLLILGAGIYFLLVIWNLNLTPWLASAGIAGIAIGFAAKDTLANLFGGLFIIIDAPYKIGDFVNLDQGERGQVTKIGLRSTRILTRDDVEITLPNANIANAKIVNESGGRWLKSRISITVGVAYGSDIEHVRGVLARAASSVDHVLPDPDPRIRFIEMADSALLFKVLVWIDEPVLRGRTIDALNTAVYNALAEANISIPFPQRDVHMYPTQPAQAG